MGRCCGGLFVLGMGLLLFVIPLFFGIKFSEGFWIVALPVSIVGIIIILNGGEDKIEQIIKGV